MKPPLSTFFRSEEIALCQLFIQPEAAYASVSELGESGTVQFRDLNPDVNAFNRKFVNEVRRCDEMERKLRYIESELRKDRVPLPDHPPVEAVQPRAPNPREIINLEARFEKTENEIMELSQNAINLKSNYLELTELRCVLEKTHSFFAEQDGRHTQSVLLQHSMLQPDEAQQGGGGGRLGFVAGVIQRERVAGFERMLWRISRGNVFLRQAELDTALSDPVTGDRLYKTVFVAFFQGEQLKTRIRKVCTGYHASIYPCPSAYEEREEMLAGVQVRLADLQLVLQQTQEHRQRVLRSVAREWTGWSVMVCKMKAIYHTLNMFNMDVSKKCLIGECWVPVHDLAAVRKALADGSESVGSTIQSFLNLIEYDEAPPTFNRVNKFTSGFQTLIDAYGVASYGEVNPALYTIVTFPMLFATMFGDLGHGAIMTMFGAWMVCYEKSLQAKRIRNEIWRIFFGGRYIILMMGLFSCYVGIVYNDIFSKSMNIFGSSWHFDLADYRGPDHLIGLDPAVESQLSGDRTYPIGVDPVWQLATNKIIFLNTYKMKLSIIFGVAHMIFGVCMSVVNMRHFRRPHAIWLEFVPQVIFLVLLFGYISFLMFFKWLAYGPRMPDNEHQPHCAPSILIMFINMMLLKQNEERVGCMRDMYSGQQVVQMLFLVLALLCVPWMLFGKPVYVWMQRKKLAEQEARIGEAAVERGETNEGLELSADEMGVSTRTAAAAEPAGGGSHDEHDNEPLSEVFILQSIHTIEYVLSTISHTASYLRLWALSLAHAQLSDVLWEMVLRNGIMMFPGPLGIIFLALMFAAWAMMTIAILVLMEGLSAFLHTLRLHWVEFMSKFYAGNGYAFVPFSFRDIIEAEEEF